MSEQEKQDNQKTIVAFAAGLLVGGLLVWVFGGAPKTDKPSDKKVEDAKSAEIKTTEEATLSEAEKSAEAKPAMQVGEGKIELDAVAAGKTVALKSAVFPTDEGWVGVRTLTDGQVGPILGVARFSKEQGLIPSVIELLSATVAGREYAVVFFGEDGDRKFSAAKDAQKEGVVASFKAK